MILKVKTHPGEGCWRYFECDQVQTSGVVDKVDDRLEDVEYHDFASGANRGFVTVAFYGAYGQPTEIVSDMEIFLLNHTGQTIDRLN